jgi:putative Mn2+ efflux pump MntP
MEIRLFKTKNWSALDIGLLKWSCILFGMMFGSYLSSFTKRYVKLFLIAAVLLAIKPAISYFRGDEDKTNIK